MKNLETLARLHVDEAIQAGLDSQAIHRALADGSPRGGRVFQPLAWLGRLAASLGRALWPAPAPQPGERIETRG
jgi:hypothetical protein